MTTCPTSCGTRFRLAHSWPNMQYMTSRDSMLPLPLSLSPLSLLPPLHPTQAFCSSITGTLATMAILKGVGVGDSAATPLAATITWMLKGEQLSHKTCETAGGFMRPTKSCSLPRRVLDCRWRWNAGEDLVCLDARVCCCCRLVHLCLSCCMPRQSCPVLCCYGVFTGQTWTAMLRSGGQPLWPVPLSQPRNHLMSLGQIHGGHSERRWNFPGAIGSTVSGGLPLHSLSGQHLKGTAARSPPQHISVCAHWHISCTEPSP